VSDIQESILAAIDNGARDTAALEEATGLEKQQIYGAVHFLKKTGAIIKSDDGLVRADAAKPNGNGNGNGADREVPAATVEKRAPGRPRKINGADSDPPPRRTKRAKAAPKPRKVGKRAADSTAVTPKRPAIEVARFGEFVVIRHADLVKLAELFGAIVQWRDAIKAV
jgi:hypothetical protein